MESIKSVRSEHNRLRNRSQRIKKREFEAAEKAASQPLPTAETAEPAVNEATTEERITEEPASEEPATTQASDEETQ